MKVFILEIKLQHLPEIWRRVAVPETIRLSRLHEVIQAAMGWTNSHLHEFTARNGERFGIPEYDDYDPPLDERDVQLNAIVTRTRGWLTYLYDFGDSWEHRVTVTKVVTLPDRPKRAEFIAGACQCPPEDCGGASGYLLMLEALADPEHPEHEQYREWLPEKFDPAKLDTARVRRRVGSVRV